MGCINGGGGGGGRLDISAALAGAQIAIARALAATVFATANLPLIIKHPPQFVPKKSAPKRVYITSTIGKKLLPRCNRLRDLILGSPFNCRILAVAQTRVPKIPQDAAITRDSHYILLVSRHPCSCGYLMVGTNDERR